MILAEQTAMQASTVGTGLMLSKQTWPTYPSLLQTQTSWPLSGPPWLGDAQENCKQYNIVSHHLNRFTLWFVDVLPSKQWIFFLS